MAQYVTLIRTENADLQIDYRALANLPIIDKTLELENEPAEAKATGAEISRLDGEIDRLDGEIDRLDGEISRLDDLVGTTPVKDLIKQLADSVDVGLSKKAETAMYTGKLLADGWVYESDSYVQTITVDGVLADDNPFVDIDLRDVSDYLAIIENWMLVGRVAASADNTIVAYCYEDKPEIDIPIILKVVR